MAKFIQIDNHIINLHQVAYIDFLESGRAMVFMSGLSHEKQNISVGPEHARELLSLLGMEGQLAASSSSSRAWRETRSA